MKIIEINSDSENKDIINLFEKNTATVVSILSLLTQSQLTQKPDATSWSAGQVGEHLYRAYDLTSVVLTGGTQKLQRCAREKLTLISGPFLNLEVKMQSPDYLLPTEKQLQKQKLLDRLQKKTSEIVEMATADNLQMEYLDFDFPTIGTLSGLEWIGFQAAHTSRHLHQLNCIIQQISNGYPPIQQA